MKGWENIENKQGRTVRFLVNSYLKNRLVHAYILEGPKGVGKMETAMTFAKMLLCEGEKICGSCRACQLVAQRGHANVFYIKPDGLSIKKEQIQLLQAEFSKRAAEDSAKIYIIEDADKMSLSAANSLLKFLEEPGADTYALLLTENKEKLLPTIRSRSIVLPFQGLTQRELVSQYEAAGIEKFTALAAALTQNEEEARSLANSESFSAMVDLVVRVEECFVKSGLAPSVPIAEKQSLLRESGNAAIFFKLYLAYYREILNEHLHLDQPSGFKSHQALKTLTKEKNPVGECVRKIQLLMAAQQRLQANANVMLCLDQLFIEMKGRVEYAI